jgi:hypothetical protein
MRMLIVLLIMVGGLLPVAANAADPPTAAPPQWFGEHLAYLTDRGGVWTADNAAFRSDDEPAEAYELTWVWGAGKKTAAGTMRALTGDKRSGVIWDFRVFWDPGARKAVIQQHGFGGAYGVGETKHVDEKTLRSEQTFYGPDGSTSRSAHDWIVDGPDVHTTNTFSFADGAWKPGRTYVWKRAAMAKE